VPSAPRHRKHMRVFISYAHDNPIHEDKVKRLCDSLRVQGIDARIDIPAAAQRQDWPLWMLDQFLTADFVLVIASSEYKRRAEGRAPQGEGLGVQWEASLIRNDLYGNPRAAIHRYLPTILPGCTVADIPIWLGPTSATHYTVSSYTPEGTAELTNVICSSQAFPCKPLGPADRPPRDLRTPTEATARRLRREIIVRLAERSDNRDTSMIYADIQQLLLIGGLGLTPKDFKEPAASPQTSCLDIETAHTAIDVSRDLRQASASNTARSRLHSYLRKRTRQTGERYVGIVTDGVQWHANLIIDNTLHQLASKTTSTSDTRIAELLTWLESVLTTAVAIKPTPREIIGRLGVDSPGHIIDVAELASLYRKHRHLPFVRVKREMWARLLTTASGVSFTNDDSLFIDHTLLVAMAKIIGHAVMNLHPESQDVSAGSIMLGSRFSMAQITGVIEADFFDWVVDVPDGERFIKGLAQRLTRFEWGEVEHDILKLLYESIIRPETRKQLGEHYTPDWLAEEILENCITDPLNQRILDASCGSGTFIFHAVRRYLYEADQRKLTDVEAIRGVVKHVFGIDVHPVAVTLARVTYLLAIGKERLGANRHPAFAVPVFLGDSLKWGNQAIWSYEGLSIPTDDDYEMFVNETDCPAGDNFNDRLRFPGRVVSDTEHFDELVDDLARKATARGSGDPIPELNQVFSKFSISEADQPVIRRTFKNMCDLHDAGRDHIWGYYVRNLARPTWWAQPSNRLDILVGNPPWLSYRNMTSRQQAAFHTMIKDRALKGRSRFAPTQDLSALFVVRCVEQYLKPGGRFAFVMPGGVLTLDQYKGFRTGVYGGQTEQARVRFERPWDLHRIRPRFFSQHVSVVSGTRSQPEQSARPLTEIPEVWSGRFATKTASKREAQHSITRTIAELPPMLIASDSPYGRRFNQGATFIPQFVFFVEKEDEDVGSLGAGFGRRSVRSRRRPTEHPPWSDIDSLHEAIEEEFIRPAYLGESMLPFRLLDPIEAIIPWDGVRLLRGSEEDIYKYPGLGMWWQHAEAIWNQFRSNDRLSFRERFDYQHGLTKQLPASDIRVIYNKSGQFLAAAVVLNPQAVLGQQLYWGSFTTLEEARYLTAILNSNVVTLAVRPFQSRGENNPRDFGKLPFRLSMPLYDARIPEHELLVQLAERAEVLSSSVQVPRKRDFKEARSYVRELLAREGISSEIDSIVKRFIAL
jgi:SAM-dependent methyltransferase